MTEDETPDPCPVGVVLDYDRITAQMGDYLAQDVGWHHDLEHNELSWCVEGWDERGFGEVMVMHKRTGQQVAGARVHWRALAVGAPLEQGAMN